MKQIKIFFMLMTIGLSLVSCGSDDSGDATDGDGNPSADIIVGNWSYIGDIDEGEYVADQHEPCDDEFLKFNANGTVLMTTNYCNEQAEISNLFWQKGEAANLYILSDGNGNTEEDKIVFSQNNNRMTIYEFSDVDGLYGLVFQRQ